MSSGIPVIATPAGGVGDHLRHEVNGMAVGPRSVDEMADAIVTLTLDAERRRRLGAGARQTALALDWQAELDRLGASYRAVLRESARRKAGGTRLPVPSDHAETVTISLAPPPKNCVRGQTPIANWSLTPNAGFCDGASFVIVAI
jgi:hypothetical protein